MPPRNTTRQSRTKTESCSMRDERRLWRRVSSLKDPMCTDLVTTRSLPFGFRSVNRKLQLRLVCNEHNGDGSRVKVGQLERGKRTSERRRSDKKRHALRSTRDPSSFFFTNGKKLMEEMDRSTATDREKEKKMNRLVASQDFAREKPTVRLRVFATRCTMRVWTNLL